MPSEENIMCEIVCAKFFKSSETENDRNYIFDYSHQINTVTSNNPIRHERTESTRKQDPIRRQIFKCITQQGCFQGSCQILLPGTTG